MLRYLRPIGRAVEERELSAEGDGCTEGGIGGLNKGD